MTPVIGLQWKDPRVINHPRHSWLRRRRPTAYWPGWFGKDPVDQFILT